MLGTFYLGYFPLLFFDREVLVNDADAAFLCQCYCKGRFGNRIHRRRDNRDIDCDIVGQLRAGIRLARHEIALGRDQQNIIEGYTFSNNFAIIHFKLRILVAFLAWY